MDIENSLVRIVGVNTHGLKSNSVYIASLIESNDIIFICEHWLSNAEKLIVAELTKPTHEDFFTAAEKKLQGRPYGGNCFLIRKNLLENTEIIYENENILAIQLQIGDLKLIVIGIYLSSYHDKTSIENYTDQLNNLSSIIEMYLDESEIHACFI